MRRIFPQRIAELESANVDMQIELESLAMAQVRPFPAAPTVGVMAALLSSRVATRLRTGRNGILESSLRPAPTNRWPRSFPCRAGADETTHDSPRACQEASSPSSVVRTSLPLRPEANGSMVFSLSHQRSAPGQSLAPRAAPLFQQETDFSSSFFGAAALHLQ